VRNTRRSTAALLTALGTTAALGFSLLSPAATASPPAPQEQLTPAAAPEPSAEEAADAALSAVQAEVAEATAADAPGSADDPARDLTLLLTDLATHLDDLGPAERRTAHQYLARPSDAGGDNLGGGLIVKYPDGAPVRNSCSTDVCVNWVETGKHRPSLTDSDDNDVPDYVDTTRITMQDVWDFEVDDLGYKAPPPDTRGANDKADVYIAEIGDDALYGYCIPETQVGSAWAFTSYCVLDDDYAADEFPTNTPLENLQATAAHEFFHAIQYGYDAGEDSWLTEGTAAWMEDQAYDDVDDNRQYLSSSPLSHPGRPLDHSASIGIYGSWIWWRYLSETFGNEVVRDIWDRADDSANPAGNRYSMKAVTNELASRGTSVRAVFGRFGSDNRAPAHFYEEGAAYPSAPFAKRFNLTSANRTSGFRVLELDHMSQGTIQVKPGAGFGSSWELIVTVDAPPRLRHQPFAHVVVYDGDAPVGQSTIALNKAGEGSTSVPFGSDEVTRVDLTLTNAGRAYQCWKGTQYSCLGRPLDDNLDFRYRVTARP